MPTGPSSNDPNADPSEGSKLPMPDDDGPQQSRPKPRTGTGAPLPADTLQILTGRASRSSSTAPPSRKEDSAGGSYAAGVSAGVDTILGQMVVEQGLATTDEVDQCVTQQREGPDPNQKSLAQLLVENAYVTNRQLERLRSQVEAERSHQQIPGYKVLGKIGAGAMAAVFKAKQLSLDRLVAIKVLPRRYSNNPQFIQRFYAEGRAAAQLNHPNIVQAFDVGQAGEFHYFVMEYVEGKTVHDMITENKRFNEQEALEIVINVADALRHAHEKGLIHRDVKPKNVIITPSGVAKLADLGLAREIDDKEAALAEKGKAYGTPYYIAPEQIRGDVSVGPQADIYSLGATLYHMVTGSVPFNGKNPTEVMQKHLKAPLVPPDHVNAKLSAGISEIIEMMMAKSRRHRYKNNADLLVDLRAVRQGELPPIAHKEATAIALAEVAEISESTTAGQLAVDKTYRPSVFEHRSVQFLVLLLVVLVVYAAVMTAVAVSSAFTS